MSARKGVIPISELYSQVTKILNEYGDAARLVAHESVMEVANESAKMVRKKQGAEPYNGTKYAHSWASTVEQDRLGVTGVAYSRAPHYRLTHLLENGHIDSHTGRRVGQRVHIKPVHDWAVREVYERTIMKLEGIW